MVACTRMAQGGQEHLSTPAGCAAPCWAAFSGTGRGGGQRALGLKAELDGTNGPDEHVSSTLQRYCRGLLSVESCYDSHHGFK